MKSISRTWPALLLAGAAIALPAAAKRGQHGLAAGRRGAAGVKA